MSESLWQFKGHTVMGASVCLVSRDASRPGYDVLAIQRDNNPFIPHAGEWEFPGGTLDPGETAAECALRELWEETGVHVSEEMIVWGAVYPRLQRDEQGALVYTAFFGAEVDRSVLPIPKLGTEGKRCGWMPAARFMGLEHLSAGTKELSVVGDHRRRYDNFIAGSVSGIPFAVGQRVMLGIGQCPPYQRMPVSADSMPAMAA